jgi:recombination protein RecA
MAAAHDVEALLSQLGSRLRFMKEGDAPRALALDWPELDAVLPDGGMPRGVVELAAPRALGGATSVALAAVQAGQARAAGAWCAWIDPEGTLHAPGVVAAGVDLARMLVVRAPRAHLPRVAVKLVASGAFEVVVVDVDAAGGGAEPSSFGSGSALFERVQRGRARGASREQMHYLMVRKLALAAEPTGATVLLLTDSTRLRPAPWPVALRLDLSRPDARALSVHVAKDRRGRVAPVRAVPFLPVVRLDPPPAASRRPVELVR